MALIARVSGDSWDWREEADDVDDGPLTSRSPSFVRLAGAEPASERDPADFVTMAEPKHATLRPERAHGSGAYGALSEDGVLLARWSDHEVMARTRTLRLEETTLRIHDARLERLARAVLDDATSVTDALRVLHVMWSCGDVCSSRAPLPGAPLTASYPVVQHVFEWLCGVLLRADEHLVAKLDGYAIVDDGLPAIEYSSLFVRSIIDPMMTEAIRVHEEARDLLVVAQLREVRERILWLNWTVRALQS